MPPQTKRPIGWLLLGVAFLSLLHVRPGFWGFGGYAGETWYKLPLIGLLAFVGLRMIRATS